MNKTRNKGVLLLAIMMLVSLLLAACSKEANSGGNSKVNESPANTEAAGTNAAANNGNAADTGTEELKPVTLSLIYPGGPQKDEQLVEEAMNKILKEKINASIDIQPIDWGAWGDKTNLMMSTGEKFDVIFTATWNGYGQSVAKGAYVELDDLLQQHGKDILANLDPIFLEGPRVKGKIYAIPTNKERASNQGILVRKDLVDKYKFDLSKVKTMADLEPLFQTIKENEPNVTPLYITEGTIFVQYINGLERLSDNVVPGSLAPGSTSFAWEMDDPGYLEKIKLNREWFKKGYINADAATTKAASEDMAKAGKIFAWTTALKPGKDKEVEAATGVKLVQIPLTEPYTSTGDTTNSMLAISKTSKDPERAMMLMNLLHSDKELLNLLVNGIEGKHYKKVADNVIEPLNKDSYNPGNNWMMGNQFLNYLYSNEDPQKWEQYKAFNAQAKVSPGFGFTFDLEPVKNEITQITNVDKQFAVPVLTGSVDSDKFIPQWKEKLQKAGLEKVIAEKQKQFDAFMAGKK
ncbi:ABC transporter substrate-binding protein [Paenibacillus gansuensis]|uniref:ABC transporter substrate-binding protein n=1 Tax=Paenibacillus gansuensis TaxID=306542 RepID=A0ABW5PH82_9BACL